MQKSKKIDNKIRKVFTFALALATATAAYIAPASAAALTDVSVLVSNSAPNATASYNIRFASPTTFNATTPLDCINVTFTTTATGSTAPAGMNANSGSPATVSGSTGWTGVTWSTAGQTANSFNLTPDASVTNYTANTDVTINVNNIINPSAAATYFATLQLRTGNCTGTIVDSATVAFAITGATIVSATVDPSLTFTVTNRVGQPTIKNVAMSECGSNPTALNFPTAMSAATNYYCAQQLAVATNAQHGYTVTLRGTQTSGTFLQASGRSISDHAGTNAVPTALPTLATDVAFGYATTDATLGTGTVGRFNNDTAFAGLVNTAQEVMYHDQATTGTIQNEGLADVVYGLRFSATTAAAAYTGTLVYVATPIF